MSATAWVVVGAEPRGVALVSLDADGNETQRERVRPDELASWVAAREAQLAPRWVWSDTPAWYAALLDAGVRVARCHDLRLAHAILRDSQARVTGSSAQPAAQWNAPSVAISTATVSERRADTLFDVDASDGGPRGVPDGIDAALAEFAWQREACGTGESNRLRLLLAAESAGALIAAELRAAGLPWHEDTHDRILTDALGARPAPGGVPPQMASAAAQVRAALGDPGLSIDSPPKLLRALHRVGIMVESTSRWQLAEHEHPAIPPLLEYKTLARLLSANGWAWLAEWVHDGRFRPVYVPGGVVTGRWASSGGGALQIPRQLREAVRADEGWCLVVADVAQLEPRVLAAMARDEAMADAARGRDLYAGIVDQGVIASRAEAKVAMLGAMYGATSGDSGRLVPRLRAAFPKAMALVDQAAKTGEAGGIVSTWLGRSSPAPSTGWHDIQSHASATEAAPADERRARSSARDRGRFTRNFIVQGTAAEWSLSWLADLRRRLVMLGDVDADSGAPRSGPAFARSPHIAFFLHDEVILHVPVSMAEAAAEATRQAADAATTLLFGAFPLDFPLDLRITDSAEKA